jgi:hypothetical protein
MTWPAVLATDILSLSALPLPFTDMVCFVRSISYTLKKGWSKCHNLFDYIAACTSGCKRGVYCKRKYRFSTVVIDRQGKNGIN